MRFLLADDHILVREGLKKFLERKFKNATVIESGSLKETLEKISISPKFNLVLLDLIMPGMEGYESIATVCKAATPTPVTMLSGADLTKKDIREAFSYGAKGFFPKAMDSDKLKGAIELVLNGDQYVPPLVLTTPPPTSTDYVCSLSKREKEALDFLVEGLSNREIAQRLGLAEPTVKMHVKNLYRKMGVSSLPQAVAKFLGRS